MRARGHAIPTHFASFEIRSVSFVKLCKERSAKVIENSDQIVQSQVVFVPWTKLLSSASFTAASRWRLATPTLCSSQEIGCQCLGTPGKSLCDGPREGTSSVVTAACIGNGTVSSSAVRSYERVEEGWFQERFFAVACLVRKCLRCSKNPSSHPRRMKGCRHRYKRSRRGGMKGASLVDACNNSHEV